MCLTLSLDDETMTALDNSAALRHLSREETVREAVLQLARYDEYFRNEVETGLEDIRNGRIISDEQMNAEATALLDELGGREQGE